MRNADIDSPGALPRVFAQALLLAGALALLPAAAPAQVRPGAGGFGPSSRPPGASDPLLFHVLSRVTYGPTEKSLGEIREMGADAFLERQLDPQGIDDSAVEAKLAAEVPPKTDLAFQWPHFYYEHLVRAAYSERQLQEVMVQFWENHFDTYIRYGNNDQERHDWCTLERRENDLFRKHALGRFRDLLEASAKSTAMMYFLDNYQNNVSRGNENYARELMELHSLGVDCGYNQVDVQEVARIWTGWTGCFLVGGGIDCTGAIPPAYDKHDVDGDTITDFVFNRAAHDYLPKQALGVDWPGGEALEEGERVLDMLASHPCTARFIGRKLLEVFVTDAPSEDLVDRTAHVFLMTGGDIREVLRAIFRSPEFRDPANFGGKVRTPLEYTIAAVRATGATLQPDVGKNASSYLETYYWIRNQGMPLFANAIPTGYAEVAPMWVSANGFLQRWKYSDRLMNWYPDPNRPTHTDPMAAPARLGLSTADEVIDHFARMLFAADVDDVDHDGAVSFAEANSRRSILRAVLVGAGTEFDPGDPNQNARLREMLEQMLGFPEFQKQ